MTYPKLSALLAVAATACMSAACGNSPSVCDAGDPACVQPDASSADASGRDATVDDDGAVDDADATVAMDASTSGDGGSEPDAGPVVCVPTAEADEPDVDGVDANCDGVDGDVNLAVFVATSGSDQGAGTRASPFATLTHAISFASGNGKTQVLAGEGTYVESIVLAAGVSIHGSYRPLNDWSRGSNATTIVRGTSPALSATSITEATRVSRLRVESLDAATPGASSIAAIIRDSNSITIEDSVFVAGRGADGVAATQPAQPGVSPNGGAGGTGAHSNSEYCFSPGTGSNTVVGGAPAGGTLVIGGTVVRPYCTPGGRGAGITAGTLADAYGGVMGVNSILPGYCYYLMWPTTPLGGNGASGAAGTDGNAGSSLGTFASSGYVASSGTPGVDGKFGAGGGGGNRGATFNIYQPGGDIFFCPIYGGGGGGGGAGGLPGVGATGGGGGGASIALLSWNSAVLLTRTRARAGDGGDGGDGAAGGLGGVGGMGGPGGPSTSGTIPGYPRNYTTNAGQPGGSGGNGGVGGASGGGGGGPSIGIALVSGSVLANDSSALVIMVGQGGRGGNGGAANDGSDGDVYQTLTIP